MNLLATTKAKLMRAMKTTTPGDWTKRYSIYNYLICRIFYKGMDSCLWQEAYLRIRNSISSNNFKMIPPVLPDNWFALGISRKLLELDLDLSCFVWRTIITHHSIILKFCSCVPKAWHYYIVIKKSQIGSYTTVCKFFLWAYLT